MRAKNIHLDAHRQEITRKIPGFPVSCYCTTFRSDTYDYIDWHWHVEFQLCLTVSGSVLWLLRLNRRKYLQARAFLLILNGIHMVRPVRKEASFFCLDIPPDFICPTRDGGLYEHSVLPVLQASALHRKLITPQTEKGREILRLLNEMAAVFDEKTEGYEFVLAGHVFQIWKSLRELLAEEIGSTQGSTDDGFGTYFCICRKIMVQPCAWMKWQRTSGSAEASAAAILRNMPANHFCLSAPVSHSREHVSADRNRQNHCTDCSGLRFSQQSYYAKKFREQTGMTPGQYGSCMKANLS